MFLRIVKIEIKKAFCSKAFITAFVFCVIIAVLCAVYNIQIYNDEMRIYLSNSNADTVSVNPNLPLYSLFNHWICEDLSSLSSSVFFLFAPAAAVIPYGYSMYAEIKSGYVKNVVTRTARKNYFISKMIAAFLSGGAVLAVPAAMNFMISAMFIPAVTPDVFYDVGWTVRQASMFSELFFASPFCYSALRCMIVFMFGGMFSLVSFTLGFFLKNKFAVILAPLLIALAIHFGQNLIPTEINAPELSPIYIMCANGFRIKKLWAAAAEFFTVLLGSSAAVYFKGVKSDVF